MAASYLYHGIDIAQPGIVEPERGEAKHPHVVLVPTHKALEVVSHRTQQEVLPVVMETRHLLLVEFSLLQ